MTRTRLLARLGRNYSGAGLAWALALLAAASVASAQQSAERITPNFKDADIGQIAEAVSMATHQTFIIDPRVRANVTMLSSTPMTTDAFYQTFLAILQVHGFIAVPSGNVVKIVPDANQRFYPADDLPDHVSSTSDEIVTQVLPIKNVSAAQLVPVLRPLVPQQGHLAAYPPSNILIISDHAANVNRIMRIIERIDQAGDSAIEVIPMENASATEIVRVITTLYQGQQQQAEQGGLPLKVVADDRSNSVLISGEAAARLRIKALVAHLDTPLQHGGETQVRYLRYADAEKLATKLKEQISATTAGGGASGNAAPGAAASQAEKGTNIWADPQNNALVITAPPKTMRSLMAIIDKLDIRRAQVLVEAIIVDVDLDKSAELGVNWAVFSESSNNTTIPGATFLTPVGGASLVDLASAIQNPSSLTSSSSLATGTTLALGRVAQTGVSFAAMLRALRSDDNSNVIATPTAVTMDNQEATVKVADEVPFVTGQYTNASTATAGTVTPFQTIQREEVGTILKLTPYINEGDAIRLKIELESSSVIPKNSGPQGAVDLTTSKRTVSTNVLIEDGGIIVLGGLISNEYDRTVTQVPGLGSIPIIGNLFKDRTATQTKKNLMIFIRPQILRDGTQTAIETNSKYNFIREEQRQVGGNDDPIPLLGGVKSPILPKLPPPPPRGSTPSGQAGQPGPQPLTPTPQASPTPPPPVPHPSGVPSSEAVPQTNPPQPSDQAATPSPAPPSGATPATPPENPK
jgi:general secretion pathway protein D